MASLSCILDDITNLFHSFDNPRREAKRLVQSVIGLDEATFISHPETTISPQKIDEIHKAAKRRVKGEPLSRIEGIREFWGLDFNLSPATLDPRPDTETLVEAALTFVKAHPKNNVIARSEATKQSRDGALKTGLPRSLRSLAMTKDADNPLKILDLGTGTGCILISLLTELPNAVGYSVDYSLEAAQTALLNAEKHKVRDRFHIIQGSWMEAFKPQSFDLIVSNPPYIEESDIAELMPEVKNHDPILALSGGESGLDCYEKIIFDLKSHLCPHAHAFLEIGKGQLESLTRLIEESGLTLCDSVADLGGIPRVVEICRGDK